MTNGVAVKSFKKEVESLLASQTFIVPEHLRSSLQNWVEDQLARRVIGESTSVTKGIEILSEFQMAAGWLVAGLKSRMHIAAKAPTASRPSVES